jgi:hypothetical protein
MTSDHMYSKKNFSLQNQSRDDHRHLCPEKNAKEKTDVFSVENRFD